MGESGDWAIPKTFYGSCVPLVVMQVCHDRANPKMHSVYTCVYPN